MIVKVVMSKASGLLEEAGIPHTTSNAVLFP